MRLVFAFFLVCLITPVSVSAQTAVQAAWSAGQRGDTAFATARGERGLAAIVSFKKGMSGAQLVITGIWPSKPLYLRLSVVYANGRRVPVDTYRHAEIIDLGGKPAYKLNLKTASLRPLRGGDTLIVEDLTRRATIPLSGSSKALKSAQAAVSTQ